MSSEEAGRTRAPSTEALGRSAATVSVGSMFHRMPLSRVHIKIGIALYAALAIESWEMLSLTYIAPAVEAGLRVTAAQLGLVISALFFGMIPGALAWGPISDRIGRRATCTWSLAGYGVVTLVGSFSPNYEMLLVTRAVAGFLFAGILTITFPYFEELLPVRHRGRLTVYLAAGWPLGMLLAVGITALLGTHEWRGVIIASAVASLWVLVIRRWVPESPYWLVQRGRQDEALTTLRRLGAADAENLSAQSLSVPEVRAGSFAALFRGRLGRITVLQLVVNFLFSWGYWGLQTWLPTLLEQRGLSASSSLGFAAISAVFMIPGYVSASWLTGRYGRKKIFVGYVLAAAAGGFYFANASTLAELYIGSFVLSFFSLGAWGVWDTWVGEIYPSPVRGLGYSVGFCGQRVANTIAPSVVGILLAHASGFSSTVLFIDLFLVATAVFAVVIPETEGRELA
ncbi:MULTISPECIES: MFS transporter [Amycolatopsis]|uniref:MFS transporter n=1 Tax=Amycolatopsis echigonensis TaxID=2576905 RepID=A0A8E1VU56_9PSEU|nr:MULTISPECIES: MFS transporter [Amycolatopsis]MBB2498352.1 MFS transporter [Amycolatopsis echigonensis]